MPFTGVLRPLNAHSPPSFWPFRTVHGMREVPPACAGELPPRLCLFPKNAVSGVLRACFSRCEWVIFSRNPS